MYRFTQGSITTANFELAVHQYSNLYVALLLDMIKIIPLVDFFYCWQYLIIGRRKTIVTKNALFREN